MKRQNINGIEFLIPDDGYDCITNDAEGDGRLYVSRVSVVPGMDISQWRDATKEERDEYLESIKKERDINVPD